MLIDVCGDLISTNRVEIKSPQDLRCRLAFDCAQK